VVCKKCKKATKLDKSEVGKVKCECGGEYDVQGEFGLLFKTTVGALSPVEAYLRGETAQAMFTDFKLVQETSRMQLPFGIVQIGKCFRNEIAPRDFLFRDREFTIAEFEFFIHPEEKKCEIFDSDHKNIKVRLLDAETQEKGKDTLRNTTIGDIVKEKRLDEWHAYWLAEQLMWFEKIGLADKIKVREHVKSELSHYSSATFDMDYEYPFGSREVAGNANRGQYDLNQHIKASSQKLEIFDEKTKNKVVPRVIEPTFGIDRVFLALLCRAYHQDKSRENVVLKLPANLAPYKAAIFPMMKDEKINQIARGIFKELAMEWNIAFDESGSIGRRYARNDEIGTPMCITVDEDSVKDKMVTIRDRDSTRQIRVKISELKEIVRKVVGGESLLKLGKEVETRKKEI
jgi:glycyl-tRNA synthetase